MLNEGPTLNAQFTTAPFDSLHHGDGDVLFLSFDLV
jgi:hypothetical protein